MYFKVYFFIHESLNHSWTQTCSQDGFDLCLYKCLNTRAPTLIALHILRLGLYLPSHNPIKSIALPKKLCKLTNKLYNISPIVDSKMRPTMGLLRYLLGAFSWWLTLTIICKKTLHNLWKTIQTLCIDVVQPTHSLCANTQMITNNLLRIKWMHALEQIINIIH